MGNWDAQDVNHAAELLAGDFYGDRPAEKLESIRIAKKKRAAELCRKLGCTKESVVLEIGSGMGFTSKHIAKEVKHLYCADISESFLKIAREECAGIPNIDFIKIDQMPATFSFPEEHFDIIFADAVFIHLNIYDIYWYFTEFQRLTKKRGKVFFNIKNASRLDMDKLSQMAEFYRQDRNNLDTLICWNSAKAVIAIAKKFGFKLVTRGKLAWIYQGTSVHLLFRKQ